MSINKWYTFFYFVRMKNKRIDIAIKDDFYVSESLVQKDKLY